VDEFFFDIISLILKMKYEALKLISGKTAERYITSRKSYIIHIFNAMFSKKKKPSSNHGKMVFI